MKVFFGPMILKRRFFLKTTPGGSMIFTKFYTIDFPTPNLYSWKGILINGLIPWFHIQKVKL